MLPSVNPSLLADNPNFANLYTYLTTNVLAPDGSTIADQSEHNAVSTQLNEARALALQDELLLRTLEEIALTTTDPAKEDVNKTSQLPRKAGISSSTTSQINAKLSSQTNLLPEICDLIIDVASYLSTSLHSDPTHPLPPDAEDLLADDLATFQSILPTIAPLLSTHLINTERTLSALVTPPSQTPAPPSTSTPTKPTKSRKQNHPSLSTSISAINTSISNLQSQTLPTSLTDTANSLTNLLDTHQSTINSRIRDLELNVHGTQSRYALARSTYLFTVAKGIELKARILALEREKAVYGDEEMVEKMEEEVERLGGEEAKLDGRERELIGLLDGYEEEGGRVGGRLKIGGSGGGDGNGEEVFRVLGGRYKEVEKEIEAVKRDIERLETKVWRGK